MSGIVSGITHFVQAIFEIIAGAVSTVVDTVFWVLRETFDLVFGLLSNFASLFENILAFFFEHIVIIAVIASLAVGFLTYQARSTGTKIKKG